MHFERRDLWQAMSVRNWRIPTKGLVIAVLVLTALLVVAVLTEGGSVRDLPAPVSAAAPQPIGGGQYLYAPRSAHVPVGVHYRFTIYTHCGLDWPPAIDFNGTFWRPIGPGPASDGSGNPPPGFADPVDHGVMTLRSPTLAEYHTAPGTVMRFAPRNGSQRAAMCA